MNGIAGGGAELRDRSGDDVIVDQATGSFSASRRGACRGRGVQRRLMEIRRTLGLPLWDELRVPEDRGWPLSRPLQRPVSQVSDPCDSREVMFTSHCIVARYSIGAIHTSPNIRPLPFPRQASSHRIRFGQAID